MIWPLLAAPILYACANRFRGSSQKFVDKRIVCAVMALGLASITPWMASLPVAGLVMAALLTGHGNFIDLGRFKLPIGQERLERIIRSLKNNLSGYQYDFLGLMLTGLVVTLPLGIATLNPAIAFLGLLKAPCYSIGWLVCPRYAVEIGEALTGAVYGFVFVIWGIGK